VQLRFLDDLQAFAGIYVLKGTILNHLQVIDISTNTSILQVQAAPEDLMTYLMVTAG